MTVDDAMLDDYGNPIGQLTVNLGQPQPVAVTDGSMETAQASALEDAAADLPGITPQEIGEYYPGYDDGTKRDKAKRLLIIEGRSLPDVATRTGVPERTVLMWSANFKWSEARRKEIAAKDELSRIDLAETRIRKRNEVFDEQLAQAKAIRNKAVKDMDREKVSLKSGTEAWAAAAKTEQTILGLSDAGKVASADGCETGKDGESGKQETKTPLVAVIVGQGGLPPIRRPVP